MGNFKITGPDGKSYKIAGDTAEGAHAALMKHLSATGGTGGPQGVAEGDTFGAQNLAVPPPPDALAEAMGAPAAAKPATSPEEEIGPVPGAAPPVKTVPTATRLDVTAPPIDGAPMLGDDPLMSAMGAGAPAPAPAEDGRLSAITKKLADPGITPETRAQMENSLRGATIRDEAAAPIPSVVAPLKPAPGAKPPAGPAGMPLSAIPAKPDTAPAMPTLAESSPFSGEPDPAIIQGVVDQVKDGDTIQIGDKSIRLAALDCPEKNRFGGKKATALMSELTDGVVVTCEMDGTVTYDRLTGYCSVDGQDLGQQMIDAEVCGVWEKYDSKGKYIGTYAGAPMTGDNASGVIPQRFINERAIVPGSSDHKTALETRLADPNLTDETRAVLTAQLDRMKREGGPELDAPENVGGPAGKPDPFKGEGAASLLKRRGQQFARGATEIFASIPESLGVAGAIADRSKVEGAATASDERAQIIADIDEALKDPDINAETRAVMERNRADLLEGQGVLAEEMAKPVVPAKEREIFKAGEKVREASSNTFGTPDPRDTGFWGKVAEGGGSVAGFATSALLPGGPVVKTVGGATLGAETNMASLYKEAIEAGSDEETAQKAAKFGMAIGASEIVPINRALKILPRSWGPKVSGRVMKGFVEIAESSGEEAAQEYLATVANNIVASGLYDPERGWTEGANEAAIIGAILGGGLGAVDTLRGDPESMREPVMAPRDGGDDETAPTLGGNRPTPSAPTGPGASGNPPTPTPPAEPAADPLATAMGLEPPTIPKPAPLPLTDKDRVKETTKPGEKTDKPEFEVMDEVETVDGEERPTGRKVRVNLNTGDAEVVEDSEISGGAQASAGAGGAAATAVPEEGKQAAVDGSPSPSAEPSKPVDTAPDAEFVGDRPPPVRKFLTSEETLAIKTNPKAFQYKSNGDEEGVTDALRNIKTFDPNRAGQVVLFERKDGTLEVADGHQRTGLARRAAAAGQADVGGTAATVYREADGYTAEEVMGLAALKNIGEGSGSAVDAARVLRTRSESIADLGLPPNSALVRKAEGIRRLSDDAFGMVANGVATEEYGDVVGRNVPDKALQAEILAALTREKPDNLAQAAMIARDMAADVTTEEQTDMFGTLQVQKSLYVERAKVLDAAMKSQGILAKTFRNLVEREGVITSAGNQLDTKANAALVDEAGQVRQYLQSQANMKGPISDALTKAAELIRSGTPVTRAAEGFVRDVKAALQGTGEGSPAPAPGGTGNEGRAENQDTAVTPAPEPGDDLFAAMTGTPKPAAPKPSTTSPSDDLLSAMGGAPAQTGKTPDQVRAEAEAKVKAAQSKAGTTKPQADAGPLFDDQQKLPSEVANDKKPADPIEAGRELLKAYSKPDDGRYVPKGSIDLRDDPMVKALATKMAAAKTAEAREALADAFVLNEGRKAKKEFLVAIGPGGELLAVMKGDKSNVPMFAEVWRALEDGKVAYVTHNHPNSGDFSGNDLLIVGMGANRVVAMAHDTGRRHIATAVPGAIPKTTLLTDNPKPFLSASSELTMMRSAVYEAGYSQVKDSDPVGLPERMGVLHRGAMSLILHRMGIIEYSGGTVAEIEAQGFNFEEIYGRTSSTFRDRLGRAGFVVSERGDQPGNQAAGSAAGTAPSVSDRPDPGPEKPDAAPDDFDAAAASVLDDIFGSVQPRTDQEPIKKPAKRSDTDIGKDLGNLFNEDPAEFLSPMERAKAKAKKRPAQRDMFDLMDAAQPGERQTDLEDLIQDLKDRDRDLFGFGEDIISTEKYARAVPLFREALAGQDVKAQPIVDTIRAVALRFRASGLTREGIERMLPYLKLYLQDVQAGKLTNPVEDSDVPGTSSGVELDSRDPATGNVVGQVDLPAADGRPGGRGGERGTAPDDQGGQRDAGNGVPDGRPAPVGTSGNPEVEGGKRGEPRPAVDRDGAGSRDRGEQRPAPDSRPAAHTERYAVDTSKPAVTERAALQAEADRLTKRDGVKLADEANVRQALPLLLPEQQDDVIKIEKRYAKPNGHGMLLTNGTGTGKTYSGGGAVKRFVQQGKDSILIAAPSQGILDAWSGALNDLGIPHTRLDGLKDMGKGVTLTTYANLGENETLADRDWDLVVTDEAHKLSQNADGDSTGALKTLRAITNHPRGRQDAAKMRRRAEWAKAEVMPDGEAKTAAMNRLFDLMRKEGAAMGDKPRAKVLFLSATPFAYVKNTDYAEGYLFDYPKDGHINGSRQDGQNLFMVENFGYRIRYHKLTRPDVGVDTGVFEREFHEKLKRDGVLSGRMLDIEPDYDRRFVLSEDKEGSQIDEILQFISDASRGKDQRAKDYQALRDSMKDTFNYLKQMQLLEAIKARKAIPDIEAHLKLGRKVVVFHDYNVGGGFNPFRPTIDGDKGIIPTAEAYAGYARLTTERPNVEKMNFTGFAPPVQALKSHFGDRAAVYNGTVPQKVRAKAKTDFQTDGSGLDVLIVQSAAGEAGISLHDTTGAHQRALVNLGMPVRPTTALQEEGRTRREGSVTDAPFRYYTIGTAWERRAFAKKIAERSGTVENLALGNQARTIRDSFIDAYGEAEPIKPAPGDGKGGKERDRAQASASPYDVAKTHYYGRMKTTGRRDQREGLDFYPTPEPVAFKMVEWAGVRAYESVLEPSAGDGAIARYLPEHARRTIVEPSTDLLSKAELRAPGSRTVNRMFEDYHVSNKHHAIVMNPPFGSGGKTAMDHLAKAMQHLKPGGRIVALIPTGPAADKRFEALWASEAAEGMTLRAVVNLPAVAFEKAGTAVMSRVLVIDNVDAIKNDLLGQAKRVNLTGADTIAQLFDRMEDISLPDRVQQLIDPTEELETEAQVDEDGNVTRSPDLIQMTPPPARMTKPIADSLGGFKLAQTKHSKTGDDLFVATAENRVDRDGYVIALGVAKQHGGWYSSFRGNGAIPGFQFKSEAQRQAFLDDMAKPVIGLNEDPAPFEDPLYSGLLRAVRGAKQQQASPKDWRAIVPKLPGVKKAEIEWLGVDEYLATLENQGVRQVTRGDLGRFIDENRIKMAIDVLGDTKGLPQKQAYEPVPNLSRWYLPEYEDVETQLQNDDEANYGEPDYRIETDDGYYPDDWDEEAENYMDEARDEVTEEAESEWDDDEEEFDPEIHVNEDDVKERAKKLAEERFEVTSYGARIYDRNGYQPEYSGSYDSDMGYFFADLGDADLSMSEAIDAARDIYRKKLDAAVTVKLEEVRAAGVDVDGRTRAEWMADRDDELARYEVAMARYEANNEAAQAAWEASGLSGEARFPRYTEQGGSNYREILIRVPKLNTTGRNTNEGATGETLGQFARRLGGRHLSVFHRYTDGTAAPEDMDWLEAERRKASPKKAFVQSSHFEQENIVVHARVKDRTDAQGRKVLFVEEIQSDLASKWRDVKEDSPEVAAKRAELRDAQQAASAKRREILDRLPVLLSELPTMTVYNGTDPIGVYNLAGTGPAVLMSDLTDFVRTEDGITFQHDVDHPQSQREALKAAYIKNESLKALAKEARANQVAQHGIEQELLRLGTARAADPTLPASPWADPEQYTLMVKHLLQVAAAKGYDKLAWTPGWMQARRWGKAAQEVVEGVTWSSEPADVYPVPAVRFNLAMSDNRWVGGVADRASGEILTYSGANQAVLEGKTLKQLLGPSLAKQISEEDSGSVSGKKVVFADSGYGIAYDGHIKRAIEKLVRPMGGAVIEDRSIQDFSDATNRDLQQAAIEAGAQEIIRRAVAIGIRGDYWAQAMGKIAADSKVPDADLVKSMIENDMSRGDLAALFPEAAKNEPVWSVNLSPEIQEVASKPMSMFQRPQFPDVDEVELQVDANQAMKNIIAIMPELRKELDRLNLKRVKLYYDPMADWQGRIEIDNPNDHMAIFLGSTGDAMATIHHEVIHALYWSNLFTPQEWHALKRAAMKGRWLQKYDINKRYPDLSYDERLEEAIAEEFGEVYARRQPVPKDSAVITAFNKIVRFLKAVFTAQKKAGFPTAEDVFGKVLSGEIGARFRKGQPMMPEPGTRQRFQKARLPGKQARAHMATPMGGQHLHIPDRNVWQELSRAGAPIWQRLAGTAGAARDAVDRARVVIQDRMLPLRRAQFMIEQRRGAPLPSNMDAYTVETTFSGKVGRHLFEIDEDYTKPIVSLIAQTKGRLTAENVGTWLYARHAIERNARIASINPRMPDGGSGMTNADARQILADAAASPDAATLDKIGVFIDLLRERSLTLRQNKGLITAAEANRWRTQYKHYVPLKGWADSDQSDAMLDVSGVGRRYSTRGAESRRALGRQSEAFNPLQAAITQAQEVAIRAEKNAVGQAVIELAKAYPSPAMWSVKQVKMKQVFNRTTGLVELRPEDPKTMFLDPNEMAVKVSGQEYRIMFHDPRLARSLGAVGADQMNGVIRILSILSRFFSMTRTMLNPEFMVTNAFRDFQTAQFGIQAFGINPKTKKDDRAAIALAMSKNWRKAFAGVYRGQGNKTNTTWSQYFKEFQQAGANISFWMLDQPEVAIGDLDKRIDLARGTKAARMLKRLRPSAVFNMRDNPVLAFIERTNLAVDNAIRLAAFIKARELGWEVQDAAFLAKELTVNFNRRGETTSSVNALYPFFNAAIQGSMRIAKALTSKRVAILVLMSVAAGTVLDLTNAALSDLDDDDELFYDKIPEYRSERNLHLVLWGTGDNPAAIPMPYGYNVFPYAGQQIGKVMRGIKTPEEAFGDVMAAAFGAFSPINGGSATTTAAPFIADPFIELAENRNFAGNTIYPAYPDTGAPDSQIFYPSATMASKYVAETLNDLTGGDFRQSGYLDFSPETLDHLSQFVGGSASAFWGRSTDILGKVLSGQTEEIEQRDVPFVRILTTPIGEYVNRDRYRQHSLAVKDANADAKAYTDKGMPVPAEVAAKAALYEAYLAAERELDGKGEWNPTKAGALTPREENAVWLDFSKKYLKVTRPKVTP
jgi:endonuclease YncB( thermonuclease family)